MARILLLLVLAITIAACDFVDVMKEGMQQSEAVANELEETTGIKPQVGFNVQNGRLVSVTVLIPASMTRSPCESLQRRRVRRSAIISRRRRTTSS